MKIFTDKESIFPINGKYIFLDSDFLGQIFHDEDIFKSFLELIPRHNFLIDPFTEFEFLRNVFLPEQRLLREKFIDQEIFLPLPNRQETFLKLQENALILSKIYSHQKQGVNSSFVDLFLAARLMLNSRSSLLITGNKKDFPQCIFDTTSVINIEQGDGVMRSFCVISFNDTRFKDCLERLNSLEKRLAIEVNKELGEIPF